MRTEVERFISVRRRGETFSIPKGLQEKGDADTNKVIYRLIRGKEWR